MKTYFQNTAVRYSDFFNEQFNTNNQLTAIKKDEPISASFQTETKKSLAKIALNS